MSLPIFTMENKRLPNHLETFFFVIETLCNGNDFVSCRTRVADDFHTTRQHTIVTAHNFIIIFIIGLTYYLELPYTKSTLDIAVRAYCLFSTTDLLQSKCFHILLIFDVIASWQTTIPQSCVLHFAIFLALARRRGRMHSPDTNLSSHERIGKIFNKLLNTTQRPHRRPKFFLSALLRTQPHVPPGQRSFAGSPHIFWQRTVYILTIGPLISLRHAAHWVVLSNFNNIWFQQFGQLYKSAPVRGQKPTYIFLLNISRLIPHRRHFQPDLHMRRCRLLHVRYLGW